MPHTPHTFAASYLLCLKDGNVLLARRYQTGFEDGKYGLPAGHVDPGETFTQAIIREAREEIGVVVRENDLSVAHVMHRHSTTGREYVDTYFLVTHWEGSPQNMEPKKCDDLSWFPIDHLPAATIDYVRQAIDCIVKKAPYSEFGWS